MDHSSIQNFFIPDGSDIEVGANFNIMSIDEDFIRKRIYQIHMTHFISGRLQVNLGDVIKNFQVCLNNSNYEHIKEGRVCLLPELVSEINGVIDRYNNAVSQGLMAYSEYVRFKEKLETVEGEETDKHISDCVKRAADIVANLPSLISRTDAANDTNLLSGIMEFHQSGLSKLVSSCNKNIDQYKGIIKGMSDEASSRLNEIMSPELNQKMPESFARISDQIKLVNTKVLNIVYGRVSHEKHSVEVAYRHYPRALAKLAAVKKNKHTMLASLSLLLAFSLVIAGMACLAYYSTPTLPTEYLVLGVTFSSLGLIGILGAYYYNNKCVYISYESTDMQKNLDKTANVEHRESIRNVAKNQRSEPGTQNCCAMHNKNGF